MGTLAQTVLPFKLEATEDLRMLKSDTALATVLKCGTVPSTDAVGDWLHRTGKEAGLTGLSRKPCTA